MKNVLIYLVILILAIQFAAAAEVTLSHTETYESVEVEIDFVINNFLGNSVINKVTLNSPHMEITDVLDFLGWTSDFTPSQITWSDGRIETNVRNALFIYDAKANLVAQDETETISGTLYYEDTTTEDFSIDVTVKNDATGPILNDIFPADNGYARADNNNQEIRINTSDPETGVKSVTYEFSDCANPATQVTLTCNNGYCTGIADFTGYTEQDTACYTVTMTNNADEVSIINGSFGFDETPPTIHLLSPINYSYESNMFRFDVSDNKATQFQCRMEIDNIEVQQLEAFEGINAFALGVNVSEGAHDWKIICQDVVGLEGEDEDSFVYDKTPPVITLNSPAENSAIKDVLIDISVTDNQEIDTVEYSQDLDSSTWPDGDNTLTVTATDKAGNQAVASFDFFVDRTAPIISIISPDNAASFDYHGNFVIEVTDNLDTSIECAISTSVTDPVTQEVNSGEESTIQVTLPLGDFTWYIFCVDDLGNSVQSEQRSATAEDLTGPDIVIADMTYVARGTDLVVQATVTDISGVKEVTSDFDGNALTLTDQGNDVYQGSITVPSDQTTGDYTVTVFATDNQDASNSATSEVTVVENYEITVDLPSSVSPGSSVDVTGKVTKDDSSDVSGTVSITYPGGVTDVNLDSSAEFSYSFTSPSSDDNYEVIVTYETANLIYSKTVSFSVSTPVEQPVSGSKGYKKEWKGEYSGIKPKEPEPVPSSSGIEETSSELVQEETDSGMTEEEVPEEEPRVPAITGAVTGLFGAAGASSKILILLLTVTGLIIGSIYGIRHIRKKEKGNIDWGPKFG